jgi:hypothetical protein
MHWLLTYSQWTGSQYKTVNTTIENMHPADWLVAMHTKYPDAQTVLLFALEISNRQLAELRTVM